MTAPENTVSASTAKADAETGVAPERTVHAMPAAPPEASGQAHGADTVGTGPNTVSAPVSASTSVAASNTEANAAPSASPTATWLPVAEAAERTSVSESALRKWIKAGELPTRDAPGPRGLRTEVTVEAVVQRARQAGIDAAPRAGLDLADAFARLENLTGQLIAMSDRAARAEVERDHLKRRLEELKADHGSALDVERRRVDAERSRADQLSEEVASHREALIAERARADAMLAAVPRRKRHLFDRPASGVPGRSDDTALAS
jgi:hypothetical protein